MASRQLTLIPDEPQTIEQNYTCTFADNTTLGIHRWFRYSAGFSALWVREVIEAEKANGRCRIIDPFAGSGTVLLEAERSDVEAIGIEAHPFVTRVAQAKLHWREDPRIFLDFALSILDRAKREKGDIGTYPRLIHKCFPPDVLLALHSLREAWRSMADNSPFSELAWLTLVSILRVCSPVGTAQWQYVLPGKVKAKTAHPYHAFEEKAYLMAGDMAAQRKVMSSTSAMLFRDDARLCRQVSDDWADLVVTSPPYANNYDYADATRLEMSFMGEVQGWGDLQEVVRKHLVRACSQHMVGMDGELDRMLHNQLLAPISREIAPVCKELESERENHGGRKAYHTMIAAYFLDMAETWMALRRVTTDGALVCFVIGDSAPYGIYVPVHEWLGKLAVAAGFKGHSFEKLRDRNVKWKNRKHRVPLQEGRLWVKG